MTKESDLLAEIGGVVKKYDKLKKEKAKESATKQAVVKEDQTFTKADVMELVRQISGGSPAAAAAPTEPAVNVVAGQTNEPSIIVTQQNPADPAGQKQPSERQQIAHQIWKDQKSLSIVCLIAMILPICAAFIGIGIGAVYGLLTAFIGMIYPALIFVKSMSTQMRLYQKYGFKPLFQLQPRMPMQPNMMNRSQQPKDKGGLQL